MKLVIMIAVLLTIASCKSEKSGSPNGPIQQDEKILAIVIAQDSTRVLEALKRRIEVVPIYDSVKKDWKVVTDTFWYFPRFIQIDSMGRIVYDKDGNEVPSQTPIYLKVPKDSVIWRIENISFDSLIKKR